LVKRLRNQSKKPGKRGRTGFKADNVWQKAVLQPKKKKAHAWEGRNESTVESKEREKRIKLDSGLEPQSGGGGAGRLQTKRKEVPEPGFTLCLGHLKTGAKKKI